MLKKTEFLMLHDLDSYGLLAQQCADLYCRIWKEPPWEEKFWTPEMVLGMLSRELCRPNAGCVLALEKIIGIPSVIGFTWGGSVDRDDLAAIAGHQQLDFVFADVPRVFYVTELGVDPDNRRCGIGRRLTEMLLNHTRQLGQRSVILRTDRNALPARALYTRLGFTELNVADGRHSNRTYWLIKL